MAARRSPAAAGIDAVGWDEELPRYVEVRGREPELAAASVAADDGSLDLRRPSEHRRRSPDLAGVHELAHAARRDVLDERHSPHVETEAVEQVQVAFATASEAERLARRDRLRTDPSQLLLGEVLRRERRELLVEAEHEHVFDSRSGEQLEPSLERRE